MTQAFHALVGHIPAWPSTARLVTAALSRAFRWRSGPGRMSVPVVSLQWLREHEVASYKHNDDR